MKRRLDGIFHLSNSHTVFHMEKTRVLMEVIDSEAQGMCLFTILGAEFSYSSPCIRSLSVSMDAWRLMSQLSKDMTNRKRNLSLRIAVEGDKEFKFGIVNSETQKFSYVLEHDRFPLSVYRTNRVLEPSQWSLRVLLNCPMEFDRICKEACAFYDVLKLQVVSGLLQLTTDVNTEEKRSNISWDLPENVAKVEGTAGPGSWAMPLRILRVITRFCTKVDRIVIYLGRPLTFVAKRGKKIVWTLRLK